MKYTKLIGRQFTPGCIDIGLTLDVAAESVQVNVTAPYADAFDAEGTETKVFWVSPLGARGEVPVTPESADDGLVFAFQPPAEAMVAKGVLRAEVRITATDGEQKILVWHSNPLKMQITESLEDSSSQTVEIPKYKAVEVDVKTLPPGSEATGAAEHTVDILKLLLGIPAGFPGVWVGNTEPPEGYSVWINPEGTTTSVVSPTIDVEKTNGVTTLTITDINGTKTSEIVDGSAIGIPTASATVKGGVMVGNGLTMNGEKMDVDPAGTWRLVERFADDGIQNAFDELGLILVDGKLCTKVERS